MEYFKWFDSNEKKPWGLQIVLISDGSDVSTGFYHDERGFITDSTCKFKPLYWAYIKLPEANHVDRD